VHERGIEARGWGCRGSKKKGNGRTETAPKESDQRSEDTKGEKKKAPTDQTWAKGVVQVGCDVGEPPIWGNTQDPSERGARSQAQNKRALLDKKEQERKSTV